MNFDSAVGKFFTDNVQILKYIHPNVITSIGIIFNYLIYKELNKTHVNMKIIIPLIIMRFIFDILDGEVARKYNKKSKLGGFLDTISDQMFIFIIINFFIKIFKLSNLCYILYFLLTFYMIFVYDMIHDHDKLKNNNGTVNDIIPFCVNNSMIICFILIVIIYCVLKNRRNCYNIIVF
jgi:phosphatidylglycerophosphate synthase